MIVYTPIIWPDINPDTQFYPHRPYAIYDSHGAFVETIRNHVGAWDESPDRVALVPGRYTVRTDAHFGSGFSVPVVIGTGRTTIVDLQHRDHSLAGL